MIITETFEDNYFKVSYGIRPCVGEIVSGDDVVLLRHESYILIGIIDGLGHGKKAAAVAQDLKKYIQQHHFLPLDELLTQAHEAFKGTQGAVVTLAKITNNGDAEFCAIGNAETRVFSRNRNIILLPKDGAIGIRSRKIESTRWDLQNNESLLMFSDGLSRQILKPTSNCNFLYPSGVDINRAINNYGKSYDDVSLIYIHKLMPNNHDRHSDNSYA